MGITQWHLRVAPGEAREAARPEAWQPPEAPPPEAPPEPQAPASERTAPAAAASPIAVVSLALGGVVLLAEDVRSRRDRRLARDVLAAAAGDFVTRPAARRFHWPPQGAGDAVAADAASGDRALRAFVDKDLADHGAALLLCTESVARRLGDERPGCRRVTMPDLATLGRDVGGKRALWQAIAGGRA